MTDFLAHLNDQITSRVDAAGDATTGASGTWQLFGFTYPTSGTLGNSSSNLNANCWLRKVPAGKSAVDTSCLCFGYSVNTASTTNLASILHQDTPIAITSQHLLNAGHVTAQWVTINFGGGNKMFFYFFDASGNVRVGTCSNASQIQFYSPNISGHDKGIGFDYAIITLDAPLDASITPAKLIDPTSTQGVALLPGLAAGAVHNARVTKYNASAPSENQYASVEYVPSGGDPLQFQCYNVVASTTDAHAATYYSLGTNGDSGTPMFYIINNQIVATYIYSGSSVLISQVYRDIMGWINGVQTPSYANLAGFTITPGVSMSYTKTITTGDLTVGSNYTPAGLPAAGDDVGVLGNVTTPLNGGSITCKSLTIDVAGSIKRANSGGGTFTITVSDTTNGVTFNSTNTSGSTQFGTSSIQQLVINGNVVFNKGTAFPSGGSTGFGNNFVDSTNLPDAIVAGNVTLSAASTGVLHNGSYLRVTGNITKLSGSTARVSTMNNPATYAYDELEVFGQIIERSTDTSHGAAVSTYTGGSLFACGCGFMRLLKPIDFGDNEGASANQFGVDSSVGTVGGSMFVDWYGGYVTYPANYGSSYTDYLANLGTACVMILRGSVARNWSDSNGAAYFGPPVSSSGVGLSTGIGSTSSTTINTSVLGLGGGGKQQTSPYAAAGPYGSNGTY